MQLLDVLRNGLLWLLGKKLEHDVEETTLF